MPEPVIVDNVLALPLRALGDAAGAVYDRSVGIRLLHEDQVSGAEHYVVRYPAGTRGRPHRHSAAHTMVVLDGVLEVSGRRLEAGSYVHFPGGTRMVHQAPEDSPCTFVLLFDGPFDVEVLQ